jgi:uncharacterized protein YegP (UPF0339 family)
MATFELYAGKDAKWRWRLKSANGEIIASGQGYASKDAAQNGIDAVKRDAAGAEVKELGLRALLIECAVAFPTAAVVRTRSSAFAVLRCSSEPRPGLVGGRIA